MFNYIDIFFLIVIIIIIINTIKCENIQEHFNDTDDVNTIRNINSFAIDIMNNNATCNGDLTITSKLYVKDASNNIVEINSLLDEINKLIIDITNSSQKITASTNMNNKTIKINDNYRFMVDNMDVGERLLNLIQLNDNVSLKFGAPQNATTSGKIYNT